MRFGKFLASATIAGMAVLGMSAPAFASTPGQHPVPGSTWSPSGQWNQGGDDHGCQNDHQWNDSQARNGRDCGPQGNECRGEHELLPWQCGGNDCRFQLAGWDQHQQPGPWLPGRDRCGDRDHRGHRNHCTSQLVIFNFPHGTSTITEVQGPWLAVNEVAVYNGQAYTIASVHHTGFFGHDLFTVDDSAHNLVVNSDPPIWHGQAHVRICTR